MRQQTLLSSFVTSACYIFILGLLTSCGSSRPMNTDYTYFQNGADTVNAAQKLIIIQPNDILSIQVYSNTLNQEQAVIFNVPLSSNNTVQGYQVSPTGNIDMPVIGTVKVIGLSKEALQALLIKKLANYVKDPTVIVRFLQFNVNVLGEVRSPGVQKFNYDRVTLIDALSSAGDLTDYGKRENIAVIREENGTRIYHKIDLRSKSIFDSPVYLLQPNDIVYVSPNKSKLKNLSFDPDVQRRTGLFFTIFSFTLGVASFLITALRP